MHSQCNWQVEGIVGCLVLDNGLVPAYMQRKHICNNLPIDIVVLCMPREVIAD